MSLFFDYFKKTLKWRPIQDPGPIGAVVRGGALALDTVRDSILWLRLQASPETCEEQFLSFHAAARGIIRRRHESITQYRTRVVNAYAWQLLGGKRAGFPKMLSYLGYPNVYTYNLKNDDPERWAEFKVILPLPEDTTITEADIKTIDDVVNDQKPAKSKLAEITLTRERQHNLMVATASSIKISLQVGPYIPASRMTGSDLYQSTAMMVSISMTIPAEE